MKKRLHDIDIWRKPWFRQLNMPEKLAVLYLFDACDDVGVWEPDLEVAQILIGGKVDWNKVEIAMHGDLEKLDERRIWITDFCRFQYKTIDGNNNAQKSYRYLAEKHGLLERIRSMYIGDNGQVLALVSPTSGSGEGQVRGRSGPLDQEQEQDKDFSLSSGVREDNSEDVGEEIRYDVRESLWYGITDEQIEIWKVAYPGVDLDVALLQVGEWIKANGQPQKPLSLIIKWLKGEVLPAKKAGGTRR